MAKKTTIPVHSISERSALGLEIGRVNSDSYKMEGVMDAHRDEHYVFLFQRWGNTHAMIDFETVIFDGCCVCCILPGQVHRFVSSGGAEGWMIAAEQSWVNELYRAVFESQLSNLAPVSLDEFEASVLEDAVVLFNKVLQHAGDFPLSVQVLHSLADTAIGMFAALYMDKESRTGTAESRPQSITRQFRNLLVQQYKTTKSPAAFAASLNITPAYLNEAVKQVTGLPVSYWIQREIILEAKRMLYYTDNNAREIAYALGYDDPAYFARLFTKVAGVSPLRFRKDYRK